MKVNIAVVGRFHGFNLAYSLQKMGILNKLITTYPKFIVKKWKIDKSKVVSEVFLEIVNRYIKKIPFFSAKKLDLFVHKKHAVNAVRFLDECDIFIGWSDSSLETLIKAKEMGKITILERGSSHCSYWRKILSEEYALIEKPFDLNYPVWQRELLEYELADYIAIPSKFVAKTFIDYGVPESKLLINPYGVDLSEFRQVAKKDNVFRIIYAGGGTIQKGFHYLLRSFSELDLPNSELWHFGTVNAEVESYIKKYKNDKIIFHGHKPQNQLYQYYSQGNIFILASIQDGFGMVLTQAMACGLPIIATTNTGGLDLVTENGVEGFIIPIRDVDEIKNKILFLYNNPDIAREMGEKAKQRVSKGFTWEDYGKRYYNNLNEIYSNAIK